MLKAFLSSLIVCAGRVSVSAAGVVTLSMHNGNGGGLEFNTTAFSLLNQSAPGVMVNEATLTVGDSQCLFDFLYASEEQFSGGDGSQSALLLVGDRTDDNAGPDFFTYGFSGFGSGVTFRGQWDIDYDNLNYNVDMRRVLFNNGDAPNAVLTITFSDASVVTYQFPDLPIQETYSIQIPGPASFCLVPIGMIACVRRRR